MTASEASAHLQRAISLLTAAKSVVDSATLRAGVDNLVVRGEDGTVSVMADGAVTIDPTERLLQKSVTDSIKSNKHYAMIAVPKGDTCPTCDGRGTI